MWIELCIGAALLGVIIGIAHLLGGCE